jgi:hypothetical protein
MRVGCCLDDGWVMAEVCGVARPFSLQERRMLFFAIQGRIKLKTQPSEEIAFHTSVNYETPK